MSRSRVLVIGAGVSGLVTTKVLRHLGFDVETHERAADVGGVWSATRRYPGLATQNPRDTYAFSDFPMPRHYPHWPSGEQVQAYLESYADAFDLRPALRLSSEVVRAVPGDHGWTITTRAAGAAAERVTHAGHLVVANGVYCEPYLPEWPGRAEFEAAGGRVVPVHAVRSVDEAAGRHVVVVGYGKSASDVAVPLSDAAATLTMVARHLVWKIPPRIGRVDLSTAMMTRLAEGAFGFATLRGPERLLHGRLRLGRRLLGGLGTLVDRVQRLDRIGLRPPGSFHPPFALMTDGLPERVAAGRITVHGNQEVVRLRGADGVPRAELRDGTRLRADLLVCGTGFEQDVPFLPADVRAKVLDEHGSFRLYRHIHPPLVPGLSFAGYNGSLLCPLGAEVGAVWLGALLTGRLTLPSTADMLAATDARLDWLRARANRRHQRGASVIPFSWHNVDEMLRDLPGLDVGPLVRAAQWVSRPRPSNYRGIADRLTERG